MSSKKLNEVHSGAIYVNKSSIGRRGRVKAIKIELFYIEEEL